MIDYTLILRKRYEAEWTLNGDDYDNLVWLSDTPKPTKKELDDQWESVLAEIEAQKQAKIAAKEAAQAKLAALGLTLDDLKALGL
jgi:hypothetical protein